MNGDRDLLRALNIVCCSTEGLLSWGRIHSIYILVPRATSTINRPFQTQTDLPGDDDIIT